MKKTTFLAVFKIVVLLFALVVGLLFIAEDEIKLMSEESKTLNGDPVYNRITFFQKDGRDIWMMNQSHFGANPEVDKWERLAIVIDKSQNPKKVQFYQLKPGELIWSSDLPNQQVPYRVSCFMCHSNGPRAIRPNYENFKMSWPNKIKIFFWNMRIKSYGRIVETNEQKNMDSELAKPFRHRGEFDNETLKVQTCKNCHNDDGFFARGSLTRQNVLTMKFMVKSGYMPPLGFHLSNAEKKQLNEFIMGF